MGAGAPHLSYQFIPVISALWLLAEGNAPASGLRGSELPPQAETLADVRGALQNFRALIDLVGELLHKRKRVHCNRKDRLAQRLLDE